MGSIITFTSTTTNFVSGSYSTSPSHLCLVSAVLISVLLHFLDPSPPSPVAPFPFNRSPITTCSPRFWSGVAISKRKPTLELTRPLQSLPRRHRSRRNFVISSGYKVSISFQSWTSYGAILSSTTLCSPRFWPGVVPLSFSSTSAATPYSPRFWPGVVSLSVNSTSSTAHSQASQTTRRPAHLLHGSKVTCFILRSCYPGSRYSKMYVVDGRCGMQ